MGILYTHRDTHIISLYLLIVICFFYKKYCVIFKILFKRLRTNCSEKQQFYGLDPKTGCLHPTSMFSKQVPFLWKVTVKGAGVSWNLRAHRGMVKWQTVGCMGLRAAAGARTRNVYRLDPHRRGFRLQPRPRALSRFSDTCNTYQSCFLSPLQRLWPTWPACLYTGH